MTTGTAALNFNPVPGIFFPLEVSEDSINNSLISGIFTLGKSTTR